MNNATEFLPNWASAPGETISDILAQKNLSISECGKQLNLTQQEMNKLIGGSFIITADIASRLSSFLGASQDFWTTRDQQYRDSLQRISRASAQHETLTWLKELPVADMIKFGWIPKVTTLSAKIEACLSFFGVASYDEWQAKYKGLKQATAFRTSLSYVSSPASVIAWLHKGRIEASTMDCKSWNRLAFQAALQKIRALTIRKSPAKFLPELIDICRECGVAVVIAPAPSGCRASGATHFLTDTKALLMLSFRYKSDDHFWFTFFHEAGHLLLHGKAAFFIESEDMHSSNEELEANEFSARFLIPIQYHPEMLTLGTNYKAVLRFSIKLGISPGIVVGQLQHNKLLGRHQLNFLKTRYQWVSD